MVDTTPIFFWREIDPQWGWLSQWYECDFEHEGTVYVTAEMWMMIHKAKLFKDEVRLQIYYQPILSKTDLACRVLSVRQESVQKMLKTRSPKEHQDLGRKVANYDGRLWDQREHPQKASRM